jgi:hypothetical protein
MSPPINNLPVILPLTLLLCDGIFGSSEPLPPPQPSHNTITVINREFMIVRFIVYSLNFSLLRYKPWAGELLPPPSPKVSNL